MENNESIQYIDEMLEWSGTLQSHVENNIENLQNQCGKEKVEYLQKDIHQLIGNLNEYKDKRSIPSDTLNTISNSADTLYQDWVSVYGELCGNIGERKEEMKPSEVEKEKDRQEANDWKPVPIGGHKLPPLPYEYDALEPYISQDIMRLHHSEHHKSYVEGLNKAERKMEKARQSGDYELIKHWEREAAFNGAGHYLHTIFWNNMSPKGGGEPKGDLLAQITKDFGSYKQFKEHFSEAAKNVEGVGWAILVWAPRAHRLEILMAEKHQNLTQWDVIPLLALDVWEHAYYLQYKNERKLYVDNWWNVVNWDDVSSRFDKAKQLKWKPY